MSALLCWLAVRGEVPAGDAWLGPAERRSAAEMRFAKRLEDFRLGRFAAKSALSRVLGGAATPAAFAALDIDNDDDGVPHLVAAPGPGGASVSISHRDGAALAAASVPPLRLGCDLEVVEPRSDAFVADYFAPAEREQLAAAPARRRHRETALVWSAKESALKVLGSGLRRDTRDVVVRWSSAAPPRGDWRPLRVEVAGGSSLRGWWRALGPWVCTVLSDPPHPAPPLRAPPPGQARTADASPHVARELAHEGALR